MPGACGGVTHCGMQSGSGVGQFGRPRAKGAHAASCEKVLVRGGSFSESSEEVESAASELQRAPPTVVHAFAVGDRVLVAGRTGPYYKAEQGNDFTGTVTKLLPEGGYMVKPFVAGRRRARAVKEPERVGPDPLEEEPKNVNPMGSLLAGGRAAKVPKPEDEDEAWRNGARLNLEAVRRRSSREAELRAAAQASELVAQDQKELADTAAKLLAIQKERTEDQRKLKL